MQQSFSSSNQELLLVLLYCFLSLLPFWSHAFCTLPPLQLLVASAASAACSEVLSCGEKEMPCCCLSHWPLPGTVLLQELSEAAEMVVLGHAGIQCHVRRHGMKCLTLALSFQHLKYPGLSSSSKVSSKLPLPLLWS